jgi:hypothetical protein
VFLEMRSWRLMLHFVGDTDFAERWERSSISHLMHLFIVSIVLMMWLFCSCVCVCVCVLIFFVNMRSFRREGGL